MFRVSQNEGCLFGALQYKDNNILKGLQISRKLPLSPRVLWNPAGRFHVSSRKSALGVWGWQSEPKVVLQVAVRRFESSGSCYIVSASKRISCRGCRNISHSNFYCIRMAVIHR